MNSDLYRNRIDWKAIMDVCGYEDMVNEVIRSSLEDALESARLLAEAVDSGRANDTALYAHRLKGVALVMGANRLALIAEQLEHAGEAKHLEASAPILADLQAELQQVADFLSQENWMDIAKQQAADVV